MCHVAAWTLDAQAKPPHGPRFQAWAARAARALPGVPTVRTCHSYRVHAPHTWRCAGGGAPPSSNSSFGAAAASPDDADGSARGAGAGCGQVYRRHSRSIDVARHACGVCRGRLVYEGKLGPDGRPLAGGGGGGVGSGAGGGGGAAAARGGGGGGALRQQQQQRQQHNGPASTTAAATPNAFAAFVAERFARVRRQAPRGTSHGEVMRRIAVEWKVEKEARRARAGGAG